MALNCSFWILSLRSLLVRLQFSLGTSEIEKRKNVDLDNNVFPLIAFELIFLADLRPSHPINVCSVVECRSNKPDQVGRVFNLIVNMLAILFVILCW